MENFKFYNDAPMLKYCQNLLNIFCFNHLASNFVIIKHTKSVSAIALLTEEYLKSKVGNRIDFANDILKKEKIIKSVPIVYYSLRKYKNMGSYDILTDISEHVMLAQLIDHLGNVHHAISAVRYWIFDSNYEKVLVLNR